MKIILITPATKQSKAGNRTTALRWSRLLRLLGHKVLIQNDWDGSAADMMLALHAWRSAGSIESFHQQYPERPLVVALTGTDIYRFQYSHPQVTLRSMELADALTGLHDWVYRGIPSRFGSKLQVIHQSALPLKRRRCLSKRTFDVCVIGHLREEKDSFRAAYAIRDLPTGSRLRLIHLGKAHNEEWALNARTEMLNNSRYHWLGEVAAWRVRQELLKTHLMVISSVMEGGANVISEAVVAGVPIIASKIDGNIGLLGEDYPGYYPAKDTESLHSLLHQAETDPVFLKQLMAHGKQRKHLFVPECEIAELQSLLESI